MSDETRVSAITLAEAVRQIEARRRAAERMYDTSPMGSHERTAWLAEHAAHGKDLAILSRVGDAAPPEPRRPPERIHCRQCGDEWTTALAGNVEERCPSCGWLGWQPAAPQGAREALAEAVCHIVGEMIVSTPGTEVVSNGQAGFPVDGRVFLRLTRAFEQWDDQYRAALSRSLAGGLR